MVVPFGPMANTGMRFAGAGIPQPQYQPVTQGGMPDLLEVFQQRKQQRQAQRQQGWGGGGQPSRARRLTEEEDSLLAKGLGVGAGLMSNVGNILDIPGSMARDVASTVMGTPRNPLDQLLSPMSDENRITGRDLNRQMGLAGEEDTWLNFAGGLATEIAMDPLTYVGGLGALNKGGQALRRSGVLDDMLAGLAKKNASRGDLARTGAREARLTMTGQDAINMAPDPVDAARRAREASDKMGLNFQKDVLDQKIGGQLGVGLPFQDPSFTFSPFGDPNALKAAQMMDNVGRMMRATLPVRMAKGLFQRDVRSTAGDLSKWYDLAGADKQELAVAAARVFREHEAQVVQNMTKMQETLVESGVLNPETVGRDGVLRNQAWMAWLDEMPPVEPPPIHESMKPHSLKLQKIIEDKHRLTEAALIDAQDFGLNINEISDNVTRYSPRQRIFLDKDADFTGGQSPMDTFNPNAMARSHWSKNVSGGKYALNELSMSPDFTFPVQTPNGWEQVPISGLRSRLKSPEMLYKPYGGVPEEFGFSAPPGARMIDSITTMLEQDPAIRALIGPPPTDGDGTWKGLAEFLVGLDKRHVDEAIPAYSMNPIKSAEDYLKNVQRTMDAAEGLFDMMGRNISPDMTGTGQIRSVRDWFEKEAPHFSKAMGPDQFDPNNQIMGAAAKKKFWQRLNQNPEIMQRLASEGYVLQPGGQFNTLDDILGQFMMPQELTADMTRYMSSFRAPESVGKVMQGLDWLNQWFKGSVTIPFPAFHVRNFVSGQFNNMIGGAFTTSALQRAARFISGDRTIDLRKIPGYETLKPDEAYRMFQEELRAQNVFGGGQGWVRDIGMQEPVASTFRRSAGMDVAQSMPGAGQPKGVVETVLPNWDQYKQPVPGMLGPVKRGMNVVKGAGGDIGNLTEAMNRISPYMALREKGWSPRAAADKVRLMQADYTDMSRFESSVMRRIFPFYSFARRMQPWFWDEITTNPGGLMGQTIRAQNRALEPDARTPDHVAGSTSLPWALPFAQPPEGTRRYLTGFGLMMEDPLSLINPLLEVGRGGAREGMMEMLSRARPELKGPLEWAFNASTFQRTPEGGRELTAMDPPVGRTLRNLEQLATGDRDYRPPVQWAPNWVQGPAEHILSNLPTSRFLTTARTLTDPRKDHLPKAMNLLTGLRVTDISPAAQDAAYSEKKKAAMKELGGRTFTRAYLPDWAKETMSPEQIEKYLLINASETGAADRTKARAAARQQESP